MVSSSGHPIGEECAPVRAGRRVRVNVRVVPSLGPGRLISSNVDNVVHDAQTATPRINLK